MNKKFLATALASISVLGFVATTAYGDEQIARPYDWTVELETRHMQDYFKYTGCQIKDIDKVRVTYQHTPTAENPDPAKTQYENFWYHDGKPLGMERQHDYEISQGDGVSILVKHRNDEVTDEECKAAANAILRVTLDSYLNKNAVVNVRIPDSSFDRVRDALIDQGCQEHTTTPDGSFASAINFFLQTDPDVTRAETLYYVAH